ncbi:hypothetical protein POM88_002156 [Heracleum sosnowskyi]|uniref:Uncharacterized protein n=1 Tax=Heracleum sosnowskyi TaxID=360622 RepID=A0AAD8JH70_9APIA|nr:hypothetical protein POM88_002156 [Heracleum sosnowskyi]
MITVILDVKWFDMKKAPSNNMKREVCKRTGAVIVSGGKNIRLTQEHNGIFVPLMEINSNFFEPVECVFSHGRKAETMSGKKMNNIDLSAGEFYDYDVECQCSISATNLKAMFEVMDAKVEAHLTNITDLELDIGVNNTNVGLYLKCEVCKRTGAVIVSGGKSIRLTQEHKGIFVLLMEINLNFFEPVECVFSHGWKAKTMSGKKMNNIDLSAGEFYDYDVECQCSISATNLKAMFEVMDAKVEVISV